MEFFAFEVKLISKKDELPETKRGIILSTSYPKAMNSLLIKFRDEYDVDNIYLDSLLVGNIQTIESETTYNDLVNVFNAINEELADSEVVV